ncbi:MAG: N-acetylglucosaminyldiphosphoundecaprenol N-acetyl-beta-D-mannosaminyltransferase [Parvicella sp.]
MKEKKVSFQRYRLFLPEYANVDYQLATEVIISKAVNNESFGVSALAVHGLMEALSDNELGAIINKIQMIVPDGQPVRWALNSFYKLNMKDRVYGPELTLRVLEEANSQRLKIFLYGSTKITLNLFSDFIKMTYPNVSVCGKHIDRFRDATEREDQDDIDRINKSGAQIVLVGRGCPRQEFWVANHVGKIDAVMMAVGAAFDFHAKTVKQAPRWMQRNGLEWLFRLAQEPKRLMRRYLVTNSKFIIKYLYHKVILKSPF